MPFRGSVRLSERVVRRFAMSLPKVPPTQHQERIGINIVAETLARINLVWRETPSTDVGIDGQIEFINDSGEATGQIVAVQVKSGPSYLRNGPDDSWAYYPSDAHRQYWEQFPVPVLLFLCDPENRLVFWVDARQYLRSPVNEGKRAIFVPKRSKLEDKTRGSLFANIGEIDDRFLDIDELINVLMERRIDKPGFAMSFFDIYATGITNIANTLYFGMDIICKVAEARANIVATGEDEFQFAYDYMRFVVAQQLADVPWSECMIDWHDRNVVPSWMARLTRRGRQVVDQVYGLETKLRESGVIDANPLLHVMQETSVAMQWSPYTYARIDLSRVLQNEHLVTDYQFAIGPEEIQ
jgi:hypothetical protein